MTTTLIFDTKQEPYLLDHVVRGVSVVSGASMIAHLLAADPVAFNKLGSLTFDQMLVVPTDGSASLSVRRTGDQVALTDESGRTTYANLSVLENAQGVSAVQELPATATRRNAHQFYAGLHQQGNEYGAGFQGVASVAVANCPANGPD